MSTLAEIEAAIPNLSLSELAELERVIAVQRRGKIPVHHSVLDIPAVSVGNVLRPFSVDDDLLGEMLEGRM